MTNTTHRASLLAADTTLIEAFWPQLEQQFAAATVSFRQGGVRPVKNPKGLLEIIPGFQPLSEGEIAGRIKQNPTENIWLLRDVVSAIATDELLQFCAAQERNGGSEQYLRVKDLLESEKLSAGLDPAFRVAAHLHKGMKSGVYATFDVLRALKVLLSQAEFTMLAPKPQPVLLQLASMDIRSYVSLRDGAKKQFPEELPPGREKLDYEFPRDFFEFNSANGQLQIQPDYLQKWKEGYSAPSPAVKGCPARLSRSESKSNVVASLYRLQVENFFRFYIESGSVK